MRYYLLILALLMVHNVYPQCTNTVRRTLKGSGIEAASDLRELPGGDIIIGGQTTGFGAGGADFFLTRMTKDGTIVWTMLPEDGMAPSKEPCRSLPHITGL